MWKNWNPFRRKHKEEENPLNGAYGKENTGDELSTPTFSTTSTHDNSEHEIDHRQSRNTSSHFQRNDFDVSHQINGVNGRVSVSLYSQEENKLQHSSPHPQRLSLKNCTARLHANDNLNRSLPISNDKLSFDTNFNGSVREESNINKLGFGKIKDESKTTSFSGVHGPLLSSPIVPKVRRALETSVHLRSPQASGLHNGKPVGRSVSLNYGSHNPAKSTAGQIPWVRLKRRESIGLTELASGNIPQSPNTVKLAAPEHRQLPAAPSFKSTPLIVTTEASRNCVVDTQTVVSALREKRKRFGASQQENSTCEDSWNSSAKRRRQDSSQSNASSVSIPPMPESLPNLMGTPGTSLLHIENLADQRPSTVPAIDAFISHHRVMGLGGERSPQQPQNFYHKQYQKNKERSSKSVLRSLQSSLSSSLRAKTNLSMLQHTGIDVKRLRALSQTKETNPKMSHDSDTPALSTNESLAEPNSKITREDTLPVVTTGTSLVSTPATATLVTSNTDMLMTSTPVMTPVSRKIADGVVLRKHSLSTNPSPVRPIKAFQTNILATSSDFERDRQREYQRRVFDVLNGDENGEGAVAKTSSEFTMISASPSSTLVASSSQSLLSATTSGAISASLDSLITQSATAPTVSTIPVTASGAVNSLSQLLKQDEAVSTSSTAATSTTSSVTTDAKTAANQTASLTSNTSSGLNLNSGPPVVTESSGLKINFGGVSSNTGSTDGANKKSGFNLDLSSKTTSSSVGSNPSLSSTPSSGNSLLFGTAPSATGGVSNITVTTSLNSGPTTGFNPNPSNKATSLPISTSSIASSTPSFNMTKPSEDAGINKPTGFTFGSVQSTASGVSLTPAGPQSVFSSSGGFSFGGTAKTTQADNNSFTFGSRETPSFTVSTASFPGQTTQSNAPVFMRSTASEATPSSSAPVFQPSLSLAATTLTTASTAASQTIFNTGIGSFVTGQQPVTNSAQSFSILNSGSTTNSAPSNFAPATSAPSVATFSFGQASSQAPSSTTFSFGQTTAAANSTPSNFIQTSTAASSAPFSFGQTTAAANSTPSNFGQTSTAASSAPFSFGQTKAAANSTPSNFGQTSTAASSAPFSFGQTAVSSGQTTSSTAAPFGQLTTTASSTPFGFSQTSTASTANPTLFNFGQAAGSTNSPFAFGASKTQAVTGSNFGSSSGISAVTTNAMFGSTATVTTGSSSIFGTGFQTSTNGNTATGFGTNSTQQNFNSQGTTSAFGFSTPITAPPAFGSASSNLSGSGFGASVLQNNKPFNFGAASTNTNQSSIFGTNNSQPPAFGSSTTQPQAFGSSTTQPPAFGTNTTQPSAFGTSITQPPAFGTSTSQPPAFGTNTAQPPAFGTNTNQPPAFGTSTTQPPPFGSATNQLPAFGSNTIFGAPTTQTPSIFGSKTSSVFGSSSGSVFGASINVTTMATATPTFGSFSTPVFGTPSISQQNPAFGATSQSFNPSATATFGTPQKNLFGSTPASSFGSQVSQITANPMPFGGATASTVGNGGFGSSSSSLLGTTTTTQSSFNFSGGQTQQANTFGSQPTNSTSSGFNFTLPTTQPAAGGVFNFSAQSSTRPPFTAPSPGGFNFAATSNPGGFNFSATPATPNMFTPQTPVSVSRPRVATRRATKGRPVRR